MHGVPQALGAPRILLRKILTVDFEYTANFLLDVSLELVSDFK